MAADLGKMDECVKEYLLYRGLNATAKALENELKSERDRIFRVDKIMEQIHSYINNYDLTSLREYWSFLEHHLFSHVDAPYTSVLHKLNTNLLRFYLVNALQSGRNDKVTEFFDKLTSHLQTLPEWRDWFVLPFIRNPEEQQPFMMFFNKQWQDTMFLCLHNFLSTKPMLLNYEDDSKLISKLELENSQLRKQVSQLLVSNRVRTKSGSAVEMVNESIHSPSNLSAFDTSDISDPVDQYSMPTSVELLDDFYAISQSTPEADKPTPRTEQIKSFIRNIALPSSPVLAKKSASGTSVCSSQTASTVLSASVASHSTPSNQAKQVATAGGQQMPRAQSAKAFVDSSSSSFASMPTAEASECTPATAAAAVKGQPTAVKGQPADDSTLEGNSPYLLLSQDEYREHTACIAQCRFSFSGETIATLDVDGVLKTWTIQPSPVTVASTMSKSMLTSVEWANGSDRLLLLGTKVGSIRLFDIKDKKMVKEVMTDTTYPRIVGFATHPVNSLFATSAVGRLRGNTPAVDIHSPRVGRVSIWDLKTMKLERHLQLAPGPIAINCMSYNHNGHLLLTGAADGIVRLYDTKSGDTIGQWSAHVGEVYTTLFSTDETCCYSMGSDGKLTQWSINKTGRKLADLPVHAGASGPFMTPGASSQKHDLMQSPRGKLFALDTDGNHMITCSSRGGVIYKLDKELGLERTLNLEGHKAPVICVDWSTSVHYKLCLTASVDGRVRVSTLLTK